MNRNAIILAGALTLTASAALAAMGGHLSGIYGLPQNWNMTPAQGYGALTLLDGNPGSSMCVECHTVNPSSKILDIEQGAGLVIARTNAAQRGSHTVTNSQAGFGNSHSGGGWANDYAGAPREGGEYTRRGVWGSTGTSKYLVVSGTSIATVEENGTGWDPATADIVCESCHNIIVNTANAAADNDLLLGTYQDNVDDSICIGCHAGDEASRAPFHENGNLKPFAGTAVGHAKRHHVLTGDQLTDTYYLYNGTTDSIMWAPSASNRLANGWCLTPYSSTVTPTENLDLSAGVAIAFRNACNVAGQGTRASTEPAGIGDIRVQGASDVNCSNCHRPHNAQSTGGAFILRMGDTSLPDFAGNTWGTLTNASIFYGIRRQFDVDTSYARKVYGEYRPLCAGCHRGY